MLVKADEVIPCLVRLTAAATNDHIVLEEIDVPTGSILVFDRAYTDCGLFAACSDKQVTFVTRLKTNAIYECSRGALWQRTRSAAAFVPTQRSSLEETVWTDRKG